MVGVVTQCSPPIPVSLECPHPHRVDAGKPILVFLRVPGSKELGVI